MSFDHRFIMRLHKVKQYIFMPINSSSTLGKTHFFPYPTNNYPDSLMYDPLFILIIIFISWITAFDDVEYSTVVQLN